MIVEYVPCFHLQFYIDILMKLDLYKIVMYACQHAYGTKVVSAVFSQKLDISVSMGDHP